MKFDSYYPKDGKLVHVCIERHFDGMWYAFQKNTQLVARSSLEEVLDALRLIFKEGI